MSEEQQEVVDHVDELGIDLHHLDHQVMLAMKEIACMDHASPNVRVKAGSMYLRISARYEERQGRR